MMAQTNSLENSLARFTGLTLDPEIPPQDNIPSQQPQTDDTADYDGGDNPANADEPTTLTLRSLVTTKEAGIVIGKAGKNVAEVRDLTGVKAGVSKVIQGVHERILTISGPLDSVAKAYSLVAKHLLDNSVAPNPQAPKPTSTTIKLLVSHQLMGSIIGKAGAKIKEIQETSGAKIVISKEMLPQSTERVIEVFGLVDSIQIAIHHIGECILGDIERAVGTIFYNPQVRLGGGVASLSSRSREGNVEHRRTSTGNPLTDSHNSERASSFSSSYNSDRNINKRFLSSHNRGESGNASSDQVLTQSLNIPADMVGCIIGKGGNFINHIRRSSQSRVSISKETDAATNQRVFTVVGTHDSNEKALDMLYTQLESEKQRRLTMGSQMAGQLGGGRD